MNREQLTNVFKISSLYIAATIGAGFASGKELFLFFTIYEDSSKYGLMIAGLLFIIVGFVMLDYIRITRPNNINDLFQSLVGKKLTPIFTLLINFFLIGVLSIMLSGMANIIAELFHTSYFISSILATLLCFVILLFGIEGIVLLSQIVTPFLIVGIISLCFLLLKSVPTSATQTVTMVSGYWGISGIMYIAYNILISVVVLIDAKYLLTSRKITILSSVLGGAGLFITSYLINLVLLKYYPTILYEELPMLTLAKNYNQTVFLIWSLILFLSMLTTAVSSAVGCIDYITSKIRLPRNILIILFLCITLRLTYEGFSQLILIFYPIFGYIGVIFIMLLGYRYLRTENI